MQCTVFYSSCSSWFYHDALVFDVLATVFVGLKGSTNSKESSNKPECNVSKGSLGSLCTTPANCSLSVSISESTTMVCTERERATAAIKSNKTSLHHCLDLVSAKWPINVVNYSPTSSVIFQLEPRVVRQQLCRTPEQDTPDSVSTVLELHSYWLHRNFYAKREKERVREEQRLRPL